MKEVRTRFAPSPTGFQHIGGFRTALYAWLLARKHGGKFLLRIEDTDQARRVPGAIKYIVDSLHWLGIDYDEGPSQEDLDKLGEPSSCAPAEAGPFGPYIQSMRQTEYLPVAEKLVDEGFAYRCDCTPEKLAAEREEQQAKKITPGYSGYCRNRNVSAETKHVVRLKIPSDLNISFEDAVRGKVNFTNPSLRDPVLLKADGMPTYHLASVVDDHRMKISHVLRGEEWLSTAPIHCLLYDALGWPRPIFCHLSHILGSDGKKLSKRHGAEALQVFIDKGYLPEALLNFIVRIGWSLGEGDDKEIFTRSELIENFSLERLSKAGGVYDTDKLLWTNGVYIRNLADEEFNRLVQPFLDKANYKIEDCSGWDRLLPHFKERCKLLSDIVPLSSFLFVEKLDLEASNLVTKKVPLETVSTVLKASSKALANLEHFNAENIESSLKSVVAELDLKVGQVFSTVRMAVTGSMQTPPLFDTLEAIGQSKSLDRLDQAQRLLPSG